MPYAQAEVVVNGWLAARFPAARVCTETPADLADVLPCIQVVQFGGGADAYQFDTARLDIDVYAASRSAARDLAYAVRAALLQELPGQYLAGAMILRVDEFSAPSWQPYDNTNLRRFTLAVSARIHTHEETP